MKLHLLPHRIASAAANMAADFALLQRYPAESAARFRHYGWQNPAVSFGYSQKWADVAQLYPNLECIRRPTGGGIVDHAADWTYCLVIPHAHPSYDQPAPLTYRLIHEALAEALGQQGIPAALQPEDREDAKGAVGVCFQQAEAHDVILLPAGGKVAGAALKRNKRGLLLQGSVSRSPLERVVWEEFEGIFIDSLSARLDLEATEAPWPDLDPDEESYLIEQFSSPDWNQRR